MTVNSFASYERIVCSALTSTQGMPISVNNLRHSSLCSFVTLTWRRLSLSTSSAVPERDASVSRRSRVEEDRRLSSPVSFASSSSAFAS